LAQNAIWSPLTSFLLGTKISIVTIFSPAQIFAISSLPVQNLHNIRKQPFLLTQKNIALNPIFIFQKQIFSLNLTPSL
jgi:hypothetical protein